MCQLVSLSISYSVSQAEMQVASQISQSVNWSATCNEPDDYSAGKIRKEKLPKCGNMQYLTISWVISTKSVID